LLRVSLREEKSGESPFTDHSLARGIRLTAPLLHEGIVRVSLAGVSVEELGARLILRMTVTPPLHKVRVRKECPTDYDCFDVLKCEE